MRNRPYRYAKNSTCANSMTKTPSDRIQNCALGLALNTKKRPGAISKRCILTLKFSRDNKTAQFIRLWIPKTKNTSQLTTVATVCSPKVQPPIVLKSSTTPRKPQKPREQDISSFSISDSEYRIKRTRNRHIEAPLTRLSMYLKGVLIVLKRRALRKAAIHLQIKEEPCRQRI